MRRVNPLQIFFMNCITGLLPPDRFYTSAAQAGHHGPFMRARSQPQRRKRARWVRGRA